MTTREVTAVALRLFSLWLLVQVVLTVPGIVMLLTSVEHYQGQVIPILVHLLMILGFVAIGLLAAYLIWIAAASVLARSPDSESRVLDQFLLQLGGVYFMVNALAYLPRSLGFLQHSLEMSYVNLLSPLGHVFQLCIGLALLVKPSHWAKLFAQLRGRGGCVYRFRIMMSEAPQALIQNEVSHGIVAPISLLFRHFGRLCVYFSDH